MKPEELRIGNCVLAKDHHGVWFDWEIGNYEELNPDIVKHRKPIPLTEEWLIKFGFDGFDSMFIGDCWGRRDKDYAFYISKESMRFGHPQFNLEIKHVHQLQNLYFALTGEELKINESIEVN